MSDNQLSKKPESNLVQRTDIDSVLARFNEWKQLATTLIRSEFLHSSLNTPEKVIAVLLKGREIGVPVMEALSSITIINGKPTLTGQLMLALVRRSKELEKFKIERFVDRVRATVKRKGEDEVITEFGDTEATLMGLINKDNYKKQKITMYQWRALSANFRLSFPDVISGMYLTEEIDPDKEIVDTEYVVEQTPMEIYEPARKALIEASKSLEGLENWKTLYEEDVKMLPDNLKQSLVRTYMTAMTKFKKENDNGTDEHSVEQPANSEKTN